MTPPYSRLLKRVGVPPTSSQNLSPLSMLTCRAAMIKRVWSLLILPLFLLTGCETELDPIERYVPFAPLCIAVLYLATKLCQRAASGRVSEIGAGEF